MMSQTDTHCCSQQLEKAQSQLAPPKCKAHDALLDWVQAQSDSPAETESGCLTSLLSINARQDFRQGCKYAAEVLSSVRYLFPTLWQKLFSSAARTNTGSQICTAVCNQAPLSSVGLLDQVEQGMSKLVPSSSISVLLYDCQENRQHLCTAKQCHTLTRAGLRRKKRCYQYQLGRKRNSSFILPMLCFIHKVGMKFACYSFRGE